MAKGKYEKVGKKAIKAGALEYSSTDDLAILSLKVLDTIDKNSKKLSAKDAMLVLRDAADIYLQFQNI
ncbi:hypothetical protein [Blautia massiliensis (ex Liu et al. 2021)]|uniref:hypothetical protein n=1 Tax=Blautia massiliensis (ex Liu et al. 2021) TaxID=3062492 RepID=UPI003F8A20F5